MIRRLWKIWKKGTLGCGCFFLLLSILWGEPFMIGFGKQKITPTLQNSVWIAGFQPKRKATGIHDDLWARTILFEVQGRIFVFTSLDCIGILHPDLWKIRKRAWEKFQINPYQIVISATHTHSGPDTLGIWGRKFTESGKNPLYLKKIEKAVLDSIGEALKNKKDAKIRFARVNVEPVIKDSRSPKVKDPYFFILQAVDKRGATLGTWSNLAMHPEVLTGKNTLISSDYPHYLREKLEKELGGVAVFTVGAIGGMQTPKRQSHGFREAKRMGQWIARQGIGALQNKAYFVPHYARFQFQKVFFPITNIKFILAVYMGLFGSDLREKVLRQSTFFPFWSLESDIAYIEIGRLGILTIPGELFPELALKIYQKFGRQNTILLGLANNEIGYILPKESWTPDGYEETMSLGPDTAPILFEALQNLWRKSQKKP